MRVYVPATLAQVRAWHAAGGIPAETPANAVTAALRSQHPDADEEELEFLATRDAHAAAVAAGAGERPAVLAVDVATSAQSAAVSSAVTLGDAAPVRDWAALFLDDLEWYAIGELPHVK